jgi:hypothetical protein
MTGVEEFYVRIRGRVEMVWPLESMEYGTLEFGVRDPDAGVCGIEVSSLSSLW